jgi:hypothetical protein
MLSQKRMKYLLITLLIFLIESELIRTSSETFALFSNKCEDPKNFTITYKSVLEEILWI